MPPKNKRRLSKVSDDSKVSKRNGQKKAKTTLNTLPEAPASQVLDIFVWGTGSMCELGLGPAAKTKEVKRPRLNPFLNKDDVGIVDFAVGGMHTLALDKNNKVWSWGANDSFVLGRSTDGKDKLKEIKDDDDDDDDDGDLNEAESTPAVVENLPDGVENAKIVQLAATDNLSAVLFDNGDVYAWGTFRSNEGILGFSPETTMQKVPKKITELKKIVALASGKDHILALDVLGHVYAWGDGQQYQLGRKIMERTKLQSLKPSPVGLKNIKSIASGDYHCFAINNEGKVYAWGLNQFGQCGTKEQLEDNDIITKPTEVTRLSDKSIVQIECGEHHTLALSSDGKLYGFGRVDMFELGIGKKDLPEYSFKDAHGKVRAVPFPTLIPGLPSVKTIGCGSHHSVAITTDGVMFSWGYGDTYAVGQGPAGEDVETPTRIKNTATQEHDMVKVGCGGQFCVAGGVKMSEEAADAREDKYE